MNCKWVLAAWILTVAVTSRTGDPNIKPGSYHENILLDSAVLSQSPAENMARCRGEFLPGWARCREGVKHVDGIVKLGASRPIRPQDMVDGASSSPTILGRDSPT